MPILRSMFTGSSEQFLRHRSVANQRRDPLCRPREGGVGQLLADSMFQLPDAQGGEQETLGAGQRADRGHFSWGGILDVVLPGTATACFGFTSTARFLAQGEMTCVVHA